MWKAYIQSVATDQTASIAKVEIKYANDDGREKIVVERISDPNSIKGIVLNGVKEFERIDAVAELIKNPVLGEVDLTPSTPSISDEQIYQQKRQELVSLKQDLDLGLVDQTQYDKVLSDVQLLKP